MKTFEDFKKEILEKARRFSRESCYEYKRAFNSATKEELLRVIVDNINFCCKNNVFDCESILFYSKKELMEVGIYINHKENIITDKSIYVISNDSSTIGKVTISGGSTLREVISFGNSTIGKVTISDGSTLREVISRDSSIIGKVTIGDGSTIS